tara:strand:- start:1011 stop:1247 length:237 start_codon:yes stop_codon:yes gene_type:complete
MKELDLFVGLMSLLIVGLVLTSRRERNEKLRANKPEIEGIYNGRKKHKGSSGVSKTKVQDKNRLKPLKEKIVKLNKLN